LEQNVQSPEPVLSAADRAPMNLLDIPTLTHRMMKGDEMAWRIFYNAYFNRLWRYLLVVAAGDKDHAREALQATFLRVVRHVKVFPDENVFWSWLTVVARTAFADETKKRRRYLAVLNRFAHDSPAEHDGLGDAQTEEWLNQLLERHVALLPSDERELVEQKYFRHRTVREIVAMLQTSEKAVESKLYRIRRKLKDAILSELNEEKD
jgi:RNA polymerase sigma-70 factor, ECF subfamily